jgi:hypothetical protein
VTPEVVPEHLVHCDSGSDQHRHYRGWVCPGEFDVHPVRAGRCIDPGRTQRLHRHGGIRGAHVQRGCLAVEQGRERTGRDQRPVVEHCHMRAGRLDLGEQVGGHQHGGAVGMQLGDDPPNLAGPRRIQAVGRLVEHHQPPAHQQYRG